MTVVYRVQDSDGRGPFKPGLSHVWLDDRDREGMLSWIEEFGMDAINEAKSRGLHVGSACRTVDGLKRWFSRTERRRLKRLGYEPVLLKVDVVLGESEIQLLIGRKRPLDIDATVIKWNGR